MWILFSSTAKGSYWDTYFLPAFFIAVSTILYWNFSFIKQFLLKHSRKQFADPNSTKSDDYNANGKCSKIDLSSSSKKKVVKVAIIGSGVGGASAAQGLCERFTKKSIDITIIEKSNRIGGRCKVIECSSSKERFEGGASIISELNELFKAYMERLNLKRIKGKVNIPLLIHGGGSQKDDNPWIFVSPTGFDDFFPSFLSNILNRLVSLRWKLKSFDFIGTIQIFRRYGLRELRSLKNILSRDQRNKLSFKDIYNNLESGTKIYRTPEEMMFEICLNDAEKFDKLTKNSAQNAIFGEEEKTPIITDLVDTGARCNYGGQGCESLHGFVGLVSLAGGIASKCFAVEGGNEQVPRGLIEELIAERRETNIGSENVNSNFLDKSCGEGGRFQILFNTKCIEVRKGYSGGYVITMEQQEKRIVKQYDIVFVCAPLEQSSEVKFAPKIPCIDSWKNRDHRMRRCVTTFVRGVLNPAFFQTKSTSVFPILEILTTSQSNLPIYSLAVKIPCTLGTTEEMINYLTAKYRKQAEADKPQFVYKIFSPNFLSEQDLNLFFKRNFETVSIEDWYAYPEYKIPQDFLPFVLEESSKSLLLYGNAIEQVAGAMEMSLISGRNLANITADWVKKNL